MLPRQLSPYYRLLLSIWLCLLVQVSRADEPRWRTSFSSRNGNYTLRVVPQPPTRDKLPVAPTVWSLFENATGNQVYQLVTQDHIIQLEMALLSNDGEDIVVLDDWGSGAPFDLRPALSFYHHGRETHTYTLGQLLGPTYPFSESVSHFRWFESYHFSPATATFTLHTFTQQRVVFDGRSGQRLATTYDGLVTPRSLLAYGRIQKRGSHHYELLVCHPYYGSVVAGQRVRFRSFYTLRTGEFLIALIENGQSKYLVTSINAWWGETETCK